MKTYYSKAALLAICVISMVFGPIVASAQDGSSDVRFRSVPNVIGATDSEAIELLLASGLDPFVNSRTLLSLENIGTIAHQIPRGGDRVAVGTVVELFRSSGTVMPDLRGMRSGAVEELLDQITFRKIELSATSSLRPIDSVIDQFPSAGERFSPSVTTARIGISTGTILLPSDLIAVEPRSAGEFTPTIDRVRNRLGEFGFVGTVSINGCSRSRAGDITMCGATNQHCVVVGIDPPPNTEVSATQSITLTTEIRHEGIAHLLGDEPCVPPR